MPSPQLQKPKATCNHRPLVLVHMQTLRTEVGPSPDRLELLWMYHPHRALAQPLDLAALDVLAILQDWKLGVGTMLRSANHAFLTRVLAADAHVLDIVVIQNRVLVFLTGMAW